MRQIILDTETTGLDYKSGHKIIEFAGLEMIDRKITGRNLHLYIQPNREIDIEAQNVHGISLKDLEGKPIFAGIAQELCEYLKGAELIIHNAPFDVGFLNHELKIAGFPKIEDLCPNVIDTLKKARELFPGKRNTLDALCDRFEIDRSNRTLHGALIDCELLAEVYLSMTREQQSLQMEEDDNEIRLASSKLKRPEHLPILKANKEELETHQKYLEKLDKASGNPCLYRQIEE